MYAYCGNNPVVYEDPTGNSCESKSDLWRKNQQGQTTYTDQSGNTFTQDANNRWHDSLGHFTPDPTGTNQPPRLTADVPTDRAGQMHGNSLDTDKPAVGYTLRDQDTREIKKYGETTRENPVRRYSEKYYKENNLEMHIEMEGTKREMHTWQHDKIIEHKESHDGNRPQLNKNDY